MSAIQWKTSLKGEDIQIKNLQANTFKKKHHMVRESGIQLEMGIGNSGLHNLVSEFIFFVFSFK